MSETVCGAGNAGGVDDVEGGAVEAHIGAVEVVLAVGVGGGNEHEVRAMHELIKQVAGDSLRLDAGFNNRNLIDEISKRGMKPYVFPKKNNVLNGHLAWKLMYLELYLDVMAWLGNC